jgi:hypothetical protein
MDTSPLSATGSPLKAESSLRIRFSMPWRARKYGNAAASAESAARPSAAMTNADLMFLAEWLSLPHFHFARRGGAEWLIDCFADIYQT